MPIVNESRSTATSTSATYSGTTTYRSSHTAPPVVYNHPSATITGAIVRSESQEGYRTRPGSGKTREPDLPPTVQKWSDGPKLIQYLDALERATSTSPRGARGNYSVNARTYVRSESGSRVMSFPLSYTEVFGNRTWDWSATGAINIALVAPPPMLRGRASEPDFSKVLRDIRPTKPHAELATFVAELGDGPRTVATLAANVRGRKLSQGPINYMFGVAPAISDIKSLAKAVSASGHITNRFVEHSGRLLRRSRTWYDEPTTTTSTFPVNVIAPRLTSSSIRFYAQVTLTRTYQRFYKAGATYQYYVADSSGFLSRATRYRQMADHLLGTNFDASTFWELTPWSWLVDWSTDIGGLIAYQEDVVDDSLVLRGGYASTFDRVVDTYTVSITSNKDNNPSWSVSTPLTTSFTTTPYYKHVRKYAGSYAWSPNAEVTPRRAAILAALGLARAA